MSTPPLPVSVPVPRAPHCRSVLTATAEKKGKKRVREEEESGGVADAKEEGEDGDESGVSCRRGSPEEGEGGSINGVDAATRKALAKAAIGIVKKVRLTAGDA